ncbi:MAG: rRNA maturation RNase YbeY [Lachnospiraceae bacterium]|nr:rRNA maturation RNase YbeY [Lachnospiraceae bacterium]
MTILFDYETDEPMDLDYKAIIEKAIETTLSCEECNYEVEVNVVLTDNAGIMQVNKEFRNIDQPTDVLSFPALEYETPSDFSFLEEDNVDYLFNPESGELILGDMMISVPKIKEQAKEYGHSLERELTFLTIHSILHLCGYDHMEEDERLVMEARQKVVLDKLNSKR